MTARFFLLNLLNKFLTSRPPQVTICDQSLINASKSSRHLWSALSSLAVPATDVSSLDPFQLGCLSPNISCTSHQGQRGFAWVSTSSYRANVSFITWQIATRWGMNLGGRGFLVFRSAQLAADGWSHVQHLRLLRRARKIWWPYITYQWNNYIYVKKYQRILRHMAYHCDSIIYSCIIFVMRVSQQIKALYWFNGTNNTPGGKRRRLRITVAGPSLLSRPRRLRRHCLCTYHFP